VPFTTGLLIGIGETLAERVDTLLAIGDLHARYGHIQEVIVQNFRAKPDIAMHAQPEPDESDSLQRAFQPLLAREVPRRPCRRRRDYGYANPHSRQVG
jgi:2-iminoacetate synthase ThiH